MNPLSLETWNQGLTYEAYRRTVRRNGKVLDEVYRNPIHTSEDVDVLRPLPPLRVVAIGEDWCPDVYHTLPTWVRIAAELPGWELRIFPRDAHADLMRHFLWRKDALRVPVYAFYDEAMRLQTWWSGRSAAAEKALQELNGGRPFSQLSPQERTSVGEAFEEGYRSQFRRANLDEMLTLLRAFFHVG
ncbi:MAG: hypothetical protein QOF89_5755 [Acidobacteriota bacterium]|jgi:hypothetical protein|nr:hypothetical protein [Acidobacteriota bacterium]